MRPFALFCLLAASAAGARPKSSFIEIKSLPSTVKGLAAVVEREKTGDFRTQALWAMEAKLREAGAEVNDPDVVDALLDETLRRVFDDMAAATDIYAWEGDDAPRGDVLIRGTTLVFPGRASTGFSKSYTVRPQGKRIDRGYLNAECTVKVQVARSPAEWFLHVETKGWGVAIDPVLASDGVHRVVVRLFSKGGTVPPSIRHERPVWVGFFRQEATGGPWNPLVFNPAGAKLAREQETTLLPPDPKVKVTDAMRQHVLAVRLGDLAFINPARAALHESELRWTSLNGLSGPVVDERTSRWIDPLRTVDDALTRAVVVLRLASLGVEVTPDELFDVLVSVKQARVQAEALLAINKRLDASAETPTDDDLARLTALGGVSDVKVWRSLGRAKGGQGFKYFHKGGGGWEPIVPKK
ncbi:MAG: hypothetical protein INH41_31310 [Myxococcaceae bacterium]|nr:hypothetical protein [Myxococcaceae bacterium]MCA3016897.1 hypothetical protein [Myxococcaceae bacterium]